MKTLKTIWTRLCKVEIIRWICSQKRREWKVMKIRIIKETLLFSLLLSNLCFSLLFHFFRQTFCFFQRDEWIVILVLKKRLKLSIKGLILFVLLSGKLIDCFVLFFLFSILCNLFQKNFIMIRQNILKFIEKVFSNFKFICNLISLSVFVPFSILHTFQIFFRTLLFSVGCT